MSWVTLITGQQCFGLVKREMVSWERLGFCFFCLLLPVSLERTSQPGLRVSQTTWQTGAQSTSLSSCFPVCLWTPVSTCLSAMSTTTPSPPPLLFFFSLDPFLFVASSVSDVFTPFLYFKGFCSLLWSPSQTWGTPYNVLQNQRAWYGMFSQIPGKRELTFFSECRCWGVMALNLC